MGYHGCPIEPNDWSDGPDDPPEKECSQCKGTGIYEGLYTPDDPSSELVREPCEDCNGTGIIPSNDYESDWLWEGERD